MTDFQQRDIFGDEVPLADVVAVGNEPSLGIQAAFEDFHAANPWVYERLRDLALLMVRSGRAHFGIGLLYERLRWDIFMSTTDDASDFKLNNNYRSRYARLLAEQEPDLAHVFATRRLTG